MRGDPHHQLECKYSFYKYTALAGTSGHLIFSAKILNDSREFVNRPAISSPHLSPTYPATGSWTLGDLGDPFAKTSENVTYYMDGKINSSTIFLSLASITLGLMALQITLAISVFQMKERDSINLL